NKLSIQPKFYCTMTMAALKMATIEQLMAEEFRQSELWLKMNTTVFETTVSWKHESYEELITMSRLQFRDHHEDLYEERSRFRALAASSSIITHP
ncbi:hypothetical protein L9F63_003659, partial [Diploptera punctata]